MQSYIGPGKNLMVMAPAAVTAGELVVVGSLVGVAAADAESGAQCPIVTEGLFDLPKPTTEVIGQGTKLYMRVVDGKLTQHENSGSQPIVGVAAADAGNGAELVRCRLVLTLATGPA